MNLDLFVLVIASNYLDHKHTIYFCINLISLNKLFIEFVNIFRRSCRVRAAMEISLAGARGLALFLFSLFTIFSGSANANGLDNVDKHKSNLN